MPPLTGVGLELVIGPLCAYFLDCQISNNSVLHLLLLGEFLLSLLCAGPGGGHWGYGAVNKHMTPGLGRGRGQNVNQPTDKENQDFQASCR